jgi:hypothetical protein
MFMSSANTGNCFCCIEYCTCCLDTWVSDDLLLC